MPNLTEKRQIVKIAEEIYAQKLGEFNDAWLQKRKEAEEAYASSRKAALSSQAKKAAKLAAQLSEVFVEMESAGATMDWPRNVHYYPRGADHFFKGFSVSAFEEVTVPMNEQFNQKVKEAQAALRSFKLGVWTDGEDAMKEFSASLERIFG